MTSCPRRILPYPMDWEDCKMTCSLKKKLGSDISKSDGNSSQYYWRSFADSLEAAFGNRHRASER